MRNLLALAAAALLVFAAVGWYLGWYTISSSSDESGHQKINIDLNRDKITEDVNKGKAKLRGLLASKDNQTQQTGTESSPPSLPPGFQTTSDGALVLPPVDPKGTVVPADYTPRSVPPE